MDVPRRWAWDEEEFNRGEWGTWLLRTISATTRCAKGLGNGLRDRSAVLCRSPSPDASRAEPLSLHHDTVRRDLCVPPHIGTVEEDGSRADRGALSDDDAVDLQRAIFEAVRLEQTVHGCAVTDVDHVGIDNLREATPEQRAEWSKNLAPVWAAIAKDIGPDGEKYLALMEAGKKACAK